MAFEPSMHSAVVERLGLEAELKSAVAAGELRCTSSRSAGRGHRARLNSAAAGCWTRHAAAPRARSPHGVAPGVSVNLSAQQPSPRT